MLRRQRAALEQLGAENARFREEVTLKAKALALQEQRRHHGGFGLGPVMMLASSGAAGGGGGKNPGSVVRTFWRTLVIRSIAHELVGYKSGSVKPKHALQVRLQEQLQRFLRGNARERQKQAKAQAEIRVLRAKVEQQRRALGGVRAARNGVMQRERRVGVLEGRLATALARRDAAVAANRALRGEIEELRRERVRFGESYRRLEEGGVGCDRAMAAAIEACNLAYEQRDTAQVCIVVVYDLCDGVIRLLNNDVRHAGGAGGAGGGGADGAGGVPAAARRAGGGTVEG